MKVQPEIIRLPDGRALTLRSAGPEDAQAMVEYLNAIAGETHYLTRWPEEAAQAFTPEKEQNFLQACQDAPDRLMLTLFEEGGTVAGNVGIHAHAPWMKERHRADFGIALIRKYWGLGLGRLLTDRAIAEAKAMGFAQLELSVFSGNARAIALYERKGFAVCGRIPNAFKLKDGSCEDDLLMVRPL